MGGGRQFASLLRKNVLLKTRRPCATCFELSMPLVLFLLLVWVRKRMDVKSIGAHHFQPNMLFPLGPPVWGMLFGSSDNSTDNQNASVLPMAAAGTWAAEDFDFAGNLSQTTGPRQGSSSWRRSDSMLTREICRPSNFDRNVALIEDMMEPLLTQSFFGWSMLDFLLTADANYTARSVAMALQDFQTWSIPPFFDSLDSALKSYLTHYTDDVETVAVELQKGLEILRDGVNTPEGARVAKRLVVNLTDDLADIGSWSLGNFSMNATLCDRYLERFGLCSGFRNPSEIAQAWIDVRDWMDDTGVAHWINGTYRPWALEPVRWSLDNIHRTPELIDYSIELLRTTTEEDALSTASIVDGISWWLSHFLRSDSVTAFLLGEFDTSPLDMFGTFLPLDIMPEAQEMFPVPEGFRTDIGGEVYQFLRTMSWALDAEAEMRATSEALQSLRKNMREIATNPLSDPWDMGMQMLGLDAEPEEAEHVEQRNEEEFSTLRWITRLLDRLRGQNATSLQHDLLPELERDWRAWYSQNVNSTWVGNLFDRIQNGFPLYRSIIPWLASEDLGAVAHSLNHWLANTFICKRNTSCAYHRSGPPYDHGPDFSIEDTERWLLILQRELRPVSARSVGQGVFNVMDRMQKSDAIFSSKAMQRNVTQSIKEKERTQSAVNAFATALHHEINLWLGCHDDSRSWRGRRLQERYDSIFNELLTRKILITPYTGEAKKLIDLAIVELTESLTTSAHDRSMMGSSFMETLNRCPPWKAAGARGVKWLLESRLVTFANEQDMEAYAIERPDDVLMALVMRNANHQGDFPAGPLKVDYSIRVHAQFLPQTSRILRINRYAMFGGVHIARYPYLDLGFGYIQEVMGRSVARMRALREPMMVVSRSGQMLNTDVDVVHTEVGSNIAAREVTEPGRRAEVYTQQMPAPPYDHDRFIRLIQHTLPMLLILGWIYAVSLLIKEIVYEKQERLRDVMRIMGLKTWVYWSSWMCSAMVQMTALVTLISLILSGGRVFKHSNPLLIFCFFWIYSLATVSFSLLISSFFSRAKVAAACGGLAYYVAYLPYGLFNRFEDIMTIHAKNALCLLSSTGLGIGMSLVAKFELIEEGLQWHNLGSPPPVTYSGGAPKDGFSVGHVIMMLLIDTVLYQVLAWYIEKVCPGTLGLPQPFYFPILPSFWRGSKQSSAPVCLAKEEADVEKKDNEKIECWEPPPASLEAAVKIRQLSKTFHSGKKALRGVTLDLHQGTILGLLGHNGAGKSTTMAILTGLYPPTEGDVFVNGRSVRKDSIGVRRQLGVCLQHNALYETMTVEEHLELFCCLKSVPWTEMKCAVDSLLRDTGLEAKRHARSNTLSGGMKRKLSIGISLSGGSQVVTLDEPTAGVDATSRRDIWHLLSAYKSKRTILLSTHFMDEADILSDRIAIIAEGQLTAIGTGIYLKRHYADSYMLTLVAADGAQESRQTKAVQDLVPEAQFAGSRGRELSFTLPFKSRAKFPALFEHLQQDAVREDLGVDTYGLSATTMEEVFLQASSVHEKGLGGVVRNINGQDPSPTTSPPPQLDTFSEASTSLGSEFSKVAGDKSNKPSGVFIGRPSTASTSAGSIMSPDSLEDHNSRPSTTFIGRPAFSDQVHHPHSPGHGYPAMDLHVEDLEDPFDTRDMQRALAASLGISGTGEFELDFAPEASWATTAVSDDDPGRATTAVSDDDPGLQGPSSPHGMLSGKPDKPAAAHAGHIHVGHPPVGDTVIGVPVALDEPVRHSATNSQAVERNPEGAAFATSDHLYGPRLWVQQFRALLAKRALSVRRDRKAWASQLMLPAFFVFFALALAKLFSIKESEPPLKLSSDMFIGTVSAGAVQSSMQEHTIPFAIDGSGEFTKRIHHAFDVSKGAHDVLQTAELQNTSQYGPGVLRCDGYLCRERPMSAWLMEHNQELLLESYGAVEMRQKDPEYPALVLWFRNRAYHGIPIMIHMWNQARLQLLGFEDSHVQVWSHPLPKSSALLQEEMTGDHQLWTDLTVAVTMILAMGFIPASFVVYLVYEKASNGKHQQLLTGVSPLMYWMSSYAWDIINFLVPTLICFFIFITFQVAAYSGANSGAIFVLLVSYGLCMTPCMYCVEPLFTTPSTAYVTLICTNIFTGTLSVMSTAVLDMYETEATDLGQINMFLKAVFPWTLPNYNLGRGMIEIARNHYLNYASTEFGICAHSDGTCVRSALSFSVSGQFILHMLLMTPVWLLFRLLIEWRCCAGRLKERDAQLTDTSASSADEAVVKEAERVTRQRAGNKPEDSLLIAGLHKRFIPVKTCGCCRRRAQPFHAVRGLNVGVPRGECFGLLGVNGAGKTTTMRMITGDTEIGSGDVQVGGWSVHGHKDRARRHLGYCPQFDALPDKLTARETLALYARIRGVPPGFIQNTVQAMISRMCLEAHQNTTCEHLSGGNKRKLSTALSLIGEPDVVLLDEPSTGVDVGARRFLWDVISDIRRRGHAIVLTSHSMEECEVLCTRLTIMVDGQFQCLGTPMQLKAKYGGGYTLEVKAILGNDRSSCVRIRDFIAEHIPNAELSEESVGLFRYAVAVQGSGNGKQVPLADIFAKLEEASADGGALHGCVADYTISQTSLEEVFLHFSQYQKRTGWNVEPTDEVSTLS